MKHSSDITIIGGGINGLLTAKELMQAGRQVTVLDKSRTGQESSWAGGGILLPLYPWRQAQAITDLVKVSLAKYPLLSRELYEATGIDPEWYDCGLLICKNPDFAQALDWCVKNDIAYQSADERFFSALHTAPEHPLWLPEIAQARNPRLLKSLKAFLMTAGVRFLENRDITKIAIQHDRVASITTTEDAIDTDQLVIATGAWTGELLAKHFPERQQAVDIQPVKGEMLLFEARPDTLSHMILDGDQYLIPRRDGRILAGSTVEQTGFVKETSAQAKNRLYQFATQLFPALLDYPVIAHWAGLRPGTAEGVPYIGRHPQVDNLYINAGHFRNGLVMGPASATLLADLMLKRTPPLDPTPYQINR
ncbi:glycine oxidase ThiO [Methylomarinum sp. Ch1-1]|uniref:Glycine oxidase ThiO n=1 Tax=Methylomarinum roseum TaxID=3067653 RepID=A0AAU7NY51_9GAMM|nr:glycine oxidase ThiO [Methylomarinum sp. Ch1-1]MDP4522061.1 glycine oxidase ThiO [Methylomarinum sp. Ch1-1]